MRTYWQLVAKNPCAPDLVREPHLDIRAGDVVTIGGDYPMTITEVTPLGDGWYAGKGKTRLKPSSMRPSPCASTACASMSTSTK